MLGLGKWVRVYKQLIAQARYPGLEKDKSQFKRKCNTEPLIEQKDLNKLLKQNTPGTPEGNRSIGDFTGGKNGLEMKQTELIALKNSVSGTLYMLTKG